jgi:proline iminopeptidase
VETALQADLYPDIEPFETGWLRVGDLHTLYWEQSGKRDGMPALFLHGGPGSGATAAHRRFFDSTHYRIVVFDQRGAGRSTPLGELTDNTTEHLVEDIEALRRHLGIERWLVFGGSWGSTLSLAYAEAHPEAVSELVLRGIFLLRRREIEWFYQHGASEIFPDRWQEFVAPIPEGERDDLLAAYHRRLSSADRAVQLAAARAWSLWEGATSSLWPDPERERAFSSADFSLALARIETHYFVNGGFFESEDQLLDGIDRIRAIPAVIVQGRYDVVCPAATAWELAQRWPEAELKLVGDAGHSAFEPGIVHELVSATERFLEQQATR